MLRPPREMEPPEDWEHYPLYKDVREALQALPSGFQAEMNVSGVLATDVFTLNSAFGAMIEEQVVDSLNRARPAWDQDGRYSLYSFVRQAQRFPDVLLQKPGAAEGILFGIELKGWYLLAKEREPSFRFTVTPDACASADLIVVVPWVLSNVISGTPRIFPPYITSARYAAEYRNYHWQHLRVSASDKSVNIAQDMQPYPTKSDRIADVPVSDMGGNFGRFARTGLMDDYMRSLEDQPLCGIPAKHWRTFFKAFQDQPGETNVEASLERLARQIEEEARTQPSDKLDAAARIIADLHILLSS